MANQHAKTRIIFPIAAKLVIIISILVLVSLGMLTLLVSVISTQDVQRTAEDNNFTVNRQAGSQAEGFFRPIQSAALLYLEMLDRSEAVNLHSASEPGRDLRPAGDPELARYFFSRNQNIAAIAVTTSAGPAETDQPVKTLIPNEQFFLSNNIDLQKVQQYLETNTFTASPDGGITFINASPDFQIHLLIMVFTRLRQAGLQTIQVFFVPDELSESLSTGTNSSFMINGKGEILLHSDTDLVMGAANFSKMPLVAVMQEAGDNNRQVSYTDADGLKYFGAYLRLVQMDATVITTIPHDTVFQAVQGITRQNIALTTGVLFIAILLVWFFSKTISRPIRSLADAALQIEQGEFGVRLESKTKDELGLLTESFGKMSSALEIFGRFTNRDIAVRAMRGEIKPGGLPKHATIFFSDIRGFTEKSENFNKFFGKDAFNRIVLWLNEYFTHMIDCVEQTGGVVDKFIGDGVMAHWGTAFTAGSPALDAFNCVKTALLMREALLEINSKRTKNDPGNPEIRIGCGINTGLVIAGQIGSEQRMEYTVIGDTVNLASRTEALNKPLGTDILITEATWQLVGDKLITEEMPAVTLKGKVQPVRMFAVINFKDTASGPKTLPELRALLGIPVPEMDKVNIDAEEKKYKI
ncbi:adenylate/guanylate cyclase domain-containing protein [Spirochaetia bacterium]|nr:adenylate/guanylate cyclase domain-containing protein [Spirochaetia bacterium]